MPRANDPSPKRDPQVTHICERCGREYIWVNPNVRNPTDSFGNRLGETCKGRLISVNDYPFTQYHAADVPYSEVLHVAE